MSKVIEQGETWKTLTVDAKYQKLRDILVEIGDRDAKLNFNQASRDKMLDAFEHAVTRARKLGKEEDFFSMEMLGFLTKVREGNLMIANRRSEPLEAYFSTLADSEGKLDFPILRNPESLHRIEKTMTDGKMSMDEFRTSLTQLKGSVSPRPLGESVARERPHPMG